VTLLCHAGYTLGSATLPVNTEVLDLSCIPIVLCYVCSSRLAVFLQIISVTWQLPYMYYAAFLPYVFLSLTFGCFVNNCLSVLTSADYGKRSPFGTVPFVIIIFSVHPLVFLFFADMKTLYYFFNHTTSPFQQYIQGGPKKPHTILLSISLLSISLLNIDRFS